MPAASLEMNLDSDLFFRVTTQVPAGGVTKMGKQRVNASLIFLVVEDVFGLVIFLLHRVVTAHANGSKGIALRRHPISENGVVPGVCNAEQNCQPENCDYGYALHAITQPKSKSCRPNGETSCALSSGTLLGAGILLDDSILTSSRSRQPLLGNHRPDPPHHCRKAKHRKSGLTGRGGV